MARPYMRNMSATLQWLGGTEEEVSCKEALAEYLCGLWQDDRGSIYRLTRGSQFSIDVLTTRPCGAKRFTRALVQLTDDAIALWGCPGRKYRGERGGSQQLLWKRVGSQFRWQKLQRERARAFPERLPDKSASHEKETMHFSSVLFSHDPARPRTRRLIRIL